jgi:hypothetical protein
MSNTNKESEKSQMRQFLKRYYPILLLKNLVFPMGF